MTVRTILKMGDPRLLRSRAAGRALRDRRVARARRRHVRDDATRSTAPASLRRRSASTCSSSSSASSATIAIPMRRRFPRPCSSIRSIEPIGERRGRRLGRLSLGAGHARRGAAFRAHPLSRLRPRWQVDRSRGGGLPRPRRPARVRSPRRQALSDADPRLLPLRLHQRAVSRSSNRRTTTEFSDRPHYTAARCKGTCRSAAPGRRSTPPGCVE